MVAMREGIVIFAHGSTVASANEAVLKVTAAAAAAGQFQYVETAFLEAAPSLEDAVGRLVEQGVTHVLIIPYFLTLGVHLQRDLPAMVAKLVSFHQNVYIRVAPPLDGHPALTQILLDRANAETTDWE